MKRFLIVSAVLVLFVISAEAQVRHGWYLGADAGIAVMENTFSSFGADGFRPGYSVNLTGGYHFNDLFSLEINAGLGRSFLAEQDCCLERGYLMGSDGVRYTDLPSGMEGWRYTDLYSDVLFKSLQLAVNFNLLSPLAKGKGTPWTLNLSPVLSFVGTGSDIRVKESKETTGIGVSSLHWGYGGRLEASYTFADRYSLGLYCNVRQLTGRPSDGVEYLHGLNMISEAGVRFLINFKRKTSRKSPSDTQVSARIPAPIEILEVPSSEPAQPAEAQPAVEEEVQPEVQPEMQEEVQSEVEAPIAVIYFSFNSVWVEPGERSTVKAVAEMMKQDRSMRIRVVGWGDKVGGDEVNLRVSAQRADAVEAALCKWLIPEDRIHTEGCGIKYDAPCDAEARCVRIFRL